jgi:hypothetical protein
MKLARLPGCAGLVAAAAVVLAPVAGARDVVMKKGDLVAIPGTNLACLFDTDAKTKKLELGCVLIRVGGILPRSWGVGLLVDGTAEVVRFDAKGQSTTTKYRKTLGVAKRGTTYRLKVGDHFAGAGTKIRCGVRPGNGLVTVGCVYVLRNAKKLTHEFVMNRSFAAVLSVVPATGKARPLYVKRQPKA